jgi:hypothetical protein
MPIRLLIAAAVALTMFFAAQGAASGGAIVLKNEEVGCFLDPGDIPGAPHVDLSKGTVVIQPSGAVVLTCHGELPAGVTVTETVNRYVPCFGPPPLEPTTGHIIATPSGQVTFTCRFAAPSA